MPTTNPRLPLEPGTTPTHHPHNLSTRSAVSQKLLILVIVYASIPWLCQGQCYSTTYNGNSCQLCLSYDQTVQICKLNGVMSETCATVCCGLKYQRQTITCSSITSTKTTTQMIVAIACSPFLACLLTALCFCLCKRIRKPAAAPRTPPPSTINLNHYSLDQNFPYFINPEQTCSICLEAACNLLTLCGHSYHSPCLKEWVEKKERCPLCVSNKFNPVAVYCRDCGRAAEMSKMNGKMSVQCSGQWQRRANAKCNNCREGRPYQLELSISHQQIANHLYTFTEEQPITNPNKTTIKTTPTKPAQTNITKSTQTNIKTSPTKAMQPKIPDDIQIKIVSNMGNITSDSQTKISKYKLSKIRSSSYNKTSQNPHDKPTP